MNKRHNKTGPANRRITSRWHQLCLLCLSLTLGLPLAANATAEYALQGGTSWYRIYNPFLYSSSDPNPLKASDSAWSTDIRGALFLPLPTERSHLELTAAASQMHYNFFDNLNYTKKQFEGMYVWEYDTWIRGRLRHRIDDRLYNYFGGNSPAPQLEVPHIREDQAELALRVSSRFDLPVTLTQQTLRYMVPSNAQPFNMDSNAAQVAIRYESGTKSTLSAGVKRTRVNFPFRSATDIVALDSGYTDQELFLDTAWRYSEDTVVIGHLGTVSRRFATYADRNSNLISAELGADWHYSPKTTFIARIWDQPQANIEASNRLYVVSTGILGRMIWQSTPKTRFSLLASLENQKYQSFINGTTVNDSSGKDRISRFGLRFDYDITPRLALRVEGTREKTLSTGSGLDYPQSMVQISISYSFENVPGKFTFENQQGWNRARQQIENLR